MRRRLFFRELGGFLFVGALGAALYHAYGWSGGNPVAAVFSPVNGSMWERMKLLFVPVFLLTLFQVPLLGRDCPHLLWCRALSTLAGLALFPALCFTYGGVWGVRTLWGDGAALLLADGALFLLEGLLLRRGRTRALWRQVAGLAVLWGLMFAFALCTFRPPRVALWQDPEAARKGEPARCSQGIHIWGGSPP